MEFIEAPIYVKLSDEERNSLHEVYVILNDLVNAAEENDCEYVSDTCGNNYDRVDIALTANVLQMLAPTEKVEIGK